MTMRVYSSLDTGAPNLTGSAPSLIALLDALLVNGYGSLFATATITTDGTSVANNDTITIDGKTYTWKTTLTPAANEVLIGANAAANLSNLAAAIGSWGVANTNYGSGTAAQQNVQVTSLTSTVLTLTALKGGTAGNSIAISKSATHITLSGSTLAGGSGTDTTSGSGWTKSFSGTSKAAYKQGAGCGFYMRVLDDGSLTALTREAQFSGFETMSDVDTGTGEFPTNAQQATRLKFRKSNTAAQTVRPWIAFADNKTFYLFCWSNFGDASTDYYTAMGFGDFFTFKSGDIYNCMAIGRITSAAVDTATNENLDIVRVVSATVIATPGHYMARGYTQLGASVQWAATTGFMQNASGDTFMGNGLISVPNPTDSALYMARVYVTDITTAPSAGTTPSLRGFLRGLWVLNHAGNTVPQEYTYSGVGTLAGRTFKVLGLRSGQNTAARYVVENSDTWD